MVVGKGVFRRWYHTNNIPVPPPVPQLGLGESQNCGTESLASVGGWDKRIVLMLDHKRRQTYCEGLKCCVKVEQYGVSMIPPHKPDCVCVDSGEQERHGNSRLYRTCTNLFGLETDLWSGDCHFLYEVIGDIDASDFVPPGILLYYGQWHMTSGAVLSKVFNTLPDLWHSTFHVMACLSVSNWLPFESIFSGWWNGGWQSLRRRTKRGWLW